MMQDDRELLYIAGELSDAELAAFENTLSAESRDQAKLLRSAFAGLKGLSQDIPEPQISFDRVRHAIESAPQAKAPMWSKWLIWATPVVAACAFAIIMTRPAPSSQKEPSAPIVAKVTEPSPTVETDRAPTPPAPATVEPPKAEMVVAKTTPPKATQRRSIRRQRPVLVATNTDHLRRPSQGLVKEAPAATNEASISTMPSQESVPNPAAAKAAAEPVVVVSTTPSTKTGANAAVEVSKQTDDVLGG